MLPMNVKRLRTLVKILLFCGMFLNSMSKVSGQNCGLKNVLFVSAPESQCQFPLGFNLTFNGSKLCFGVEGNKTAACCQTQDFNCNITIEQLGTNVYNLTMTNDILSKQDIVVLTEPDKKQCMPSMLCYGIGTNVTTRKESLQESFLLQIHSCLYNGSKNIRLSQDGLCGITSTKNCNNCTRNTYNLTIGLDNATHCVTTTTTEATTTTTTTATQPHFSFNPPKDSNRPENAAKLMNNLSYIVTMMGNSSTAILTIGNITGLIEKLPRQNPNSISLGITESGTVKTLEGNVSGTVFSSLVHIPAEASDIAVKGNGSFAAVLLFPDMHPDDPKSHFLNNEVVGIEMGAEIHNLTHTINIQFNNVDKNAYNASCRSWNGTGDPAWITDGCETVEASGNITCQCSHLTFFALLMSPPITNISSSDYKSLSYITSVGCGLSMLFLVVALFIHCLIRKGKASEATKILMNLFVAMLILNFSFLINESIANLNSYGACVMMAAVMHYSMLATFTWFFIEALHMSFNLWKTLNETKNYMIKIYITGWATPAIVVIALLALNKYNTMTITKDDGTASHMCWISDSFIHQAVNIGYYAIVFIFTFSIFIATVRRIILFKPTGGKSLQKTSIKRNTFFIMSLFLLLGITWAFAFFSHGPLLLASYYIFTILNSFQGFFLFIYYYHTSKIVGGGKGEADNHSSKATSNTAMSSYQ